MSTLKYSIIKSEAQYFEYCSTLETILEKQLFSTGIQDEIDLLTLLIEKWDAEPNTFQEADPVEMLKGLMENHEMRAKDLADMLGISKGVVSDILHYRKGMSKEVIRKLSQHFKVSQECFNRPYHLTGSILHEPSKKTLPVNHSKRSKPETAKAAKKPKSAVLPPLLFRRLPQHLRIG